MENKASLAIAMAGLVADYAYQDRIDEASQLASEAMALIESLGDPVLTVGLSAMAIFAKIESGEWPDVLRWSQRVIDLADGGPSKGNFLFGSPLAVALTGRGAARHWLGRPGWRDDLHRAVAMARSADPLCYAAVVAYVYNPAIPLGLLMPDDRAVREIVDALKTPVKHFTPTEDSDGSPSVMTASQSTRCSPNRYKLLSPHPRRQQLTCGSAKFCLIAQCHPQTWKPWLVCRATWHRVNRGKGLVRVDETKTAAERAAQDAIPGIAT